MDTSNTIKLKKIHQEFMGEPNTSVDVKEISGTQSAVPQAVQKQGALQLRK